MPTVAKPLRPSEFTALYLRPTACLQFANKTRPGGPDSESSPAANFALWPIDIILVRSRDLSGIIGAAP
ncbi:unnamed protein product [Soboliphyme baturini]|uniref:Uncharacterized protein n=1 Tax=Soboliphyme baturini TaxID=241478 RepID=A0A183IWW2_9BILA|nr:unnamed protein product [Soboliphyme baturini]